MIQYYEFGNNKILTIFSSRFHEKGFKEGYETGKTQGLSEGRLLGVSKGCDIGREVGSYLGFVSIWYEILKENPNAKARCVKALRSLKEMILALPLNEPSNEELFANIEKVRAKFKLVCSLLGVSAEYFGDGVTGLSF